jgi:hypothetical protein
MAIVYNTNIVRSGLILHLDAANTKSYSGSGSTWSDMSMTAANASLVNSPNHTGSSFVFDGSTQECTVSASALNIVWSGSITRTLELWFRYVSYPSVLANYAVYGDQAGTTGSLRGYQGTNAGRFAWTWDDSQTVFSQKVMAVNEWAQVVILLEGYSATYHVNGALDTAQFTSTDQAVGSNTTWRLAKDGRFNTYLNIEVAVVRQYNRILSAAEITQNFQALRGRFSI